MRILWRVLVALVLVAAIVGIGGYAYNIGIAQGLAQKLPAAAPVPMPYPYFGHPFFGFGFGFLGCLIPFFLLFGSLRFLFWRGPMGWGHMGMRRRRWGWGGEDGKGVPPFFEEWHRRAHGEPEPDADKKQTA